MKMYLWILLVVLLGACNDVPQPASVDLADRNLDIILVVGQSNTHYGLGLDPAIDGPDSRVFQLGRFGADDHVVVVGAEPLQHHSAQAGRIGFALSFAKQYARDHLISDDGRNVVIIPSGAGGTGFGDNRWNKGDDLYEDAVERTNFILDNYPNSELVCILWHQGEADVGRSSYQAELDQFISDIRQDLNASDVPFILGGMVPYWVNMNASRIAQQAIIKGTVDRIALTGYADPTLPFVIEKPDNNFDDIHYDASGQREFACRYYAEYVRLSE